jgi:hypothetical protein
MTGKNRPHRKIIGKRKKFEKVCASKISLAETAMKSPRKVDTIPMRMIAGMTKDQATSDKFVRSAAIMIGIKALATPKRIAPEVLASISSSREIGARSNLSKDRLRFSKVIVTASMEVVPKRMEIVMTPGRSVTMLSRPLPDLIKNMPVQASGKIIPQLMLGGLR